MSSLAVLFFFFQRFFICSYSGDLPEKNVATFLKKIVPKLAIKLDMKYTTIIMLLYIWLHTQNQPNIFDNFVFFCPPPDSLMGDFIVSEGHGYPLVFVYIMEDQVMLLVNVISLVNSKFGELENKKN
jgi:hypothetical protein